MKSWYVNAQISESFQKSILIHLNYSIGQEFYLLINSALDLISKCQMDELKWTGLKIDAKVAVTLWSSFKNTFKVLCSPPPFLNPLSSIVSLRAEKLLLLPSNKPLEIPKETTETIDYLSSWCMCVFVCVGEDGWVQRVCVESETLRKSDMQVCKCAFVWMSLQFEHLEGPCCCSRNVW